MADGSISFNPSRASTSNIPTCAVTGSRNICSIGSRWTTLRNTTQRHNSTSLTGSPRDGLPTIPAAPRRRRASAELVTHELYKLGIEIYIIYVYIACVTTTHHTYKGNNMGPPSKCD